MNNLNLTTTRGDRLIEARPPRCGRLRARFDQANSYTKAWDTNIYYGSDGVAAALLPAGLKLTGTWVLEDDHYCIDWESRPKNSCSQQLRSADGFLIMDVERGEFQRLLVVNRLVKTSCSVSITELATEVEEMLNESSSL